VSDRVIEQAPSTIVPTRREGGLARYGELLLLLVLAIAALVFVLQPAIRKAKPAGDAPNPRGTPAIGGTNSASGGAADPVKIKSLGRSPMPPIFGSLPFTDEERTQQLNVCMARAKSAPTYPVDGVGMAELAHTGIVGEALVFDGPAHNLTTGRHIVWRCKIANWDGRVGGMDFSILEGVSGLPLEWNAIAKLDEEILRRCVVGARALFPGSDVPAYSNGARRGDAFQLSGTAKATDGSYQDWQCTVQLQQGTVAALDVEPVAKPQ
jgi:hypothetical protein